MPISAEVKGPRGRSQASVARQRDVLAVVKQCQHAGMTREPWRASGVLLGTDASLSPDSNLMIDG